MQYWCTFPLDSTRLVTASAAQESILQVRRKALDPSDPRAIRSRNNGLLYGAVDRENRADALSRRSFA
jgi:hypothetical protein